MLAELDAFGSRTIASTFQVTVRMAKHYRVLLTAIDDRSGTALSGFNITDATCVEIINTTSEGASPCEFHQQCFIDFNQGVLPIPQNSSSANSLAC